ncbi:MAG: hypothetical protein ACP5VR_00110 [Acidimicrobiales bacterium]
MPGPAAALGLPGGAGTVLKAEEPRTKVGRGLPRPVLAAHVGTLLAGFFVWLYLDRHLWFYGDEWDFIVRRGIWHPQLSLWVPHNEHWSTLPILLWRAIFAVVHLSHYWPYLVALLALHVCIVHLLWRRLLREGTGPWSATALGLLMALLGTAAEDLTWAFQVGFLGSVAFGLAALELAEAKRPAKAPYVLAPLAGVASLMCSDVGVAFVAALGAFAWARRGFRHAVALTAAPVMAFGVWYVLVGHEGIVGDHISARAALRVPGFVWDDSTTDMARIFSLNAVGLTVLGQVVVVGLLAWLVLNWRSLARQHPAVLALAGGDIVFHIMAALARDRFGETFSPSRYVYIDAAFLLPGLAVAVQDLVPRRSLSSVREAASRLASLRKAPLARKAFYRPTGEGSAKLQARGPGHPGRAVLGGWQLVLVGLLVACTVGNVLQGAQFARSRTAFVLLEKKQIQGAAQLLAAGQKAITLTPVRYSASLTTRGMLRLEHEHMLPTIEMTAAERGLALTVLDVRVSRRRLVPGSFALLALSGGARGRAGPRGCVTLWAAHHARSARLALRLVGDERSAAAHLATRAGSLDSSLSPGRLPLAPGLYAGMGVPHGGGWVNDAVPHYNLVLDVPPGRSSICGLSVPAVTAKAAPVPAGGHGR